MGTGSEGPDRGVVHEFNTSLNKERADIISAETRLLLAVAFPTALGMTVIKGIDDQKHGLDLAVRIPHGPPITLDMKYRDPPKDGDPYEDIFLEFEHRHHNGSTTVGWVADPHKTNDLFGYVLKWDWSCWFLPRGATQSAWQRHGKNWLVEYGERPARNPSYLSIGCPVPFDVIKREIGGVRVGDLMSIEAIDRYPNGPGYEHWCLCGRWGTYGASARYPERPSYCLAHNPPPALPLPAGPRVEPTPLIPTQGSLF